MKTCERIAKENHVAPRYVTRAERYVEGVDAAEEAVPGTRHEILSGKICPVHSAVQAVAQAPPEEREALANHLRDPEVQRRGKHRTESEEERIARMVAADMETTVPRHKVDEAAMLETLRGVTNSMIRRCDKCFELFPNLLTEQIYRVQVVDIMQEPKTYITKIESGGLQQ